MCTSKPSEINTMPTYMNSHDPTIWLIKVRSRSHNFLAFDGDLDVLNLPLFAMSRALQDRCEPMFANCARQIFHHDRSSI